MPQAPPLSTLTLVTGSGERRPIPMNRARLRIGRSPEADVVLDDRAVSRIHAEVRYEGGRCVVEDLGSSNGVFVDGERIKVAPLKPGARIRLGDSELVFTPAQVDVAVADRMRLLTSSEVLAGLDQSARQVLAEQLEAHSYPQHAVIHRQGSSLDRILFVVSGTVRLVEFNEEGGETEFGTVGAGEVYGERSLLPGHVSTCSLVAATEVCLLELERAIIDQFVQARPDLSESMCFTVREKLKSSRIDVKSALKRPDSLAHLSPPTEVVILGENRRVLQARSKIEDLAKAGKTPLIIGPPGTGKHTFARHYHRSSPSSDQPYVEISLAEMEPVAVGPAIFGAEGDPAATTTGGRIGYLEMLGSGTLVIAHAERLDHHQQSKLAAYLKLGWFHRVYGQSSVTASTRVVLIATGSDNEVREHLIPELWQELSANVIALPPLTQRLKDIPVLAEHYRTLYSRKVGKTVQSFSREAVERLVTYPWPGNLTELENVIHRAVIISADDNIIPGDLIFVSPAEKDIHKLNILHDDKVRDVLRNPWLFRGLAWLNLALVLVVLAYTLIGGSKPVNHPLQQFEDNPGMLITWLVWFPLLPISAFLIGRFWCGMCPIALVGDLAAKVKSLKLPVPKFLKRLDFWMVVVAFLFLDYVEEFFAVAKKPLATAMLLIIILGLSALFCMLFERKAFCRYICPLAGLLGTYSSLSPIEVRGNKRVCQTQCGEHTCFKGTELVPGCPLGSYPASIAASVECMMCGSCLRSCEKRGVQVNLRPPLQELWGIGRPMLSISLFGVMLVALMARHQVSELPAWQNLALSLQLSPGTFYTLAYVAFIAFVLITFTFSSTLSAGASQEGLGANMARYGMAFIPLAFSGHIAHVSHELLGEGTPELLNYLVGAVRGLVGMAPLAVPPLAAPFAHPAVAAFFKFMVVCGGMVGSLIALVMIARRVQKTQVMPRILPHLLLLLFFWSAYLWVFTTSGAPAPGPEAAAPTPATAPAEPAAPGA